MENRISRSKAIRAKCLDCCCNNKSEVRQCPATACPLHPFRMGSDPWRKKRELTPEQKDRLRSNALLRKNARNESGKPGE